MPPRKKAAARKTAAPARDFTAVPPERRRAILDGEIARLRGDQYAAHLHAESLRATDAGEEAVAEAAARVERFDEVIAGLEADRAALD